MNGREAVFEFRHLGPAEVWFCLCRDFGNHVLRPATMTDCAKCGAVAPWVERVNRRV